MARLKVCSVLDAKVAAYNAPFFVRSRGEALRSWQSAVNDPETMMCKYPEDYTLFEIGEFDESTGTLVPASPHVSLGCAVEFKRNAAEQLPLLESVKGA